MNPDSICLLVNGNVKQWQGLGQLRKDQLPACVGKHIEQGTVRFHFALLVVDTYHAANDQAELSIFWALNGEEIELVDVKPSIAPASTTLLSELGPPTATHVYSPEECVAADLLVPQDGVIEEAIYTNKGLAIAIARKPSQEAIVVRIRGFKPMPIKHYLDEYVCLEPEALH
ncbi:MAG: hypothetical protein AAGE59_23420 [Cyanobacteria bacterium P01_F01_bin.86]